MVKIFNGAIYSKKIEESGKVTEYYHPITLTEVNRDIYAIYYVFRSITTDSVGTAILDLTANTLTLNYRKIEGADSQVSGVLYSIGDNTFRGTRFFQKPSSSTTFIQLKIFE